MPLTTGSSSSQIDDLDRWVQTELAQSANLSKQDVKDFTNHFMDPADMVQSVDSMDYAYPSSTLHPRQGMLPQQYFASGQQQRQGVDQGNPLDTFSQHL